MHSIATAWHNEPETCRIGVHGQNRSCALEFVPWVVDMRASTYLKVQWVHSDPNYPVLLYSEVDLSRYEIRKVEIFASGRMGYASEKESAGGSQLGTVPVPEAGEIARDPQFIVLETDAAEFEKAWQRATCERGGL